MFLATVLNRQKKQDNQPPFFFFVEPPALAAQGRWQMGGRSACGADLRGAAAIRLISALSRHARLASISVFVAWLIIVVRVHQVDAYHDDEYYPNAMKGWKSAISAFHVVAR